MNFSLCCLHLHSEIKIVVVNRNGLPKLVLMSREVYENGLGRLTDRVLLNVHRDMELVAEPVLIRTFNNPAEIVRICEKEMKIAL